MGYAFFHGFSGSGGVRLQCSVTAYASEAVLPETAAEHAIGVITENEITGWAFSSTEPDAPAEGMVWFLTGDRGSGKISLGIGNSAVVYPILCRHYVQGGWLAETAKYYEGGWKDFGIWYYNHGDECYELSGGYVSVGNSGQLAFGTSELRVFSKSASSGGGARMANLIDLTSRNRIYFEIRKNSAGPESRIVIAADEDLTLETAAAQICLAETGNTVVYALDVSGITGAYYIGVLSGAGATDTGVYITAILGV